MSEYQGYEALTASQLNALIPLLMGKFSEYQAKGGPVADDMYDFWRWLTGLDHRCPPAYSDGLSGRWDEWSGGKVTHPLTTTWHEAEAEAKAVAETKERNQRLREARERWEQAAREDMIKLKDEDLSDEPDAW